jgi:hypothetical protein
MVRQAAARWRMGGHRPRGMHSLRRWHAHRLHRACLAALLLLAPRVLLVLSSPIDVSRPSPPPWSVVGAARSARLHKRANIECPASKYKRQNGE